MNSPPRHPAKKSIADIVRGQNQAQNGYTSKLELVACRVSRQAFGGRGRERVKGTPEESCRARAAEFRQEDLGEARVMRKKREKSDRC